MTKKYPKADESKLRRFIILLIMLCLYFIDSRIFIKHIGSTLFVYLIKPSLWVSFSLIILSFPKIRFKGLLRLKSFINLWAFNFAVIYIVFFAIAGVFDGFGKSPYDHSIAGILINTILIGSALLGRELARNYITNSFAKEENYTVFILMSLFMSFTSIPLNRFFEIKDYTNLIQFAAKEFGPEFSKNLFAVYLSFLGGTVPSIIYMGIIQAFEWFCPILPNLKWITSALIGILCPLFCLSSLQNMYKGQTNFKRSKRDGESTLAWIITCVISIGIVWFAAGVFPIYPSVIATGSMEPAIKPGDVIIVSKYDKSNFKVGDIIQYKKYDMLISHRIIKIIKENKSESFITKGDNNSVPDLEPVDRVEIRGKVIYVIPKIGWPAILIRSKRDIPLNEVVF